MQNEQVNVECNIVEGIGLEIKINKLIKEEEILSLINEIIECFLEIKTVIVAPGNANPQECIGYFHRAQSIMADYLEEINKNNLYKYEEVKL